MGIIVPKLQRNMRIKEGVQAKHLRKHLALSLCLVKKLYGFIIIITSIFWFLSQNRWCMIVKLVLSKLKLGLLVMGELGRLREFYIVSYKTQRVYGSSIPLLSQRIGRDKNPWIAEGKKCIYPKKNYIVEALNKSSFLKA